MMFRLPDAQILSRQVLILFFLISKIGFEDMKYIKRNTMAQLRTILRELRSMMLERMCWMPSELFWRKLMFHSLFISFSLNTTTFSIPSEHKPYHYFESVTTVIIIQRSSLLNNSPNKQLITSFSTTRYKIDNNCVRLNV